MNKSVFFGEGGANFPLCFIEDKKAAFRACACFCKKYGKFRLFLRAIVYPSATSSTIIRLNPIIKRIVPQFECSPSDISGISSSMTT